MASKSLYVGNLSYSVTESALKELFTEYGATDARLIADKGFAFVDVPEERATEAIAAVNGRVLDGRALIVNIARPRLHREGDAGRW